LKQPHLFLGVPLLSARTDLPADHVVEREVSDDPAGVIASDVNEIEECAETPLQLVDVWRRELSFPPETIRV
jgi:hypothetical protein